MEESRQPRWRLVPQGEPVPPRTVETGQSVTVGRSKKADWRIRDKRVSSLHARLEGDPNGLRVIDLGSRNGTFVNGGVVSEALLIPGHVLALGGMRFLLEEEPASSEGPPLPSSPPEADAVRGEGSGKTDGTDLDAVQVEGKGREGNTAPDATGRHAALRTSWLATRTSRLKGPPRRPGIAGALLAMWVWVRQVPVWTASATAHALLIWLLTLIVSHESPVTEGVLQVTLGEASQTTGERFSFSPIEAVDRTDEPLIEKGNTSFEAEDYIAAIDPPRPDTDHPSPLSSDAPSFGLSDLADAFTDARIGTAGARPARSEGGGQGNPSSTEGPISLKQGDDVFSIVSGRLKQGRPGDAKALEALRPEQIVVISGIYDHIEAVLDALKVPHIVRSTKDFDDLDLAGVKALLINCPGTLNASARERVARFVEAGGHLFTTDWVLWFLEAAFPGQVASSGQMTGDHWVDIKPEAAGHPYLQGVFTRVKGKPRWKIDNGTYPIAIKNLSGVRVLISSDQMKKGYGHSAIAVTFEHGKGHVLHCTSHFDHLTLNVHGQYAMTQMLVNFLVEAAR